MWNGFIIRAPGRTGREQPNGAPREELVNPKVRAKSSDSRSGSSFYTRSTTPRTRACDADPPHDPRLRKRLSAGDVHVHGSTNVSSSLPAHPRRSQHTWALHSERHHGCTVRSKSFPSSFTLSSSCCPRGSRPSAVWSPLPTLPPSRGPPAPPPGSVCAWPAVWL